MQTYISIIKLEIKHSSYTNGLCTDFSFSATPETNKLITGRRLLVKYRPAGLDVYAPLGSNDNLLIPIDRGLTFNWSVKLTSTTFFDKTVLPKKDRKGVFRISNPVDGTASSEEPVELKIDSLVKSYTSFHELQKGKSKQEITLERPPAHNAEIADFSFVKAIEGDTLDLNRLKWELMEDKASLQLKKKLTNNTAIHLTYPVPQKAGQNVFAVMNITLPQAFTKKTDSALHLELNLEKK